MCRLLDMRPDYCRRLPKQFDKISILNALIVNVIMCLTHDTLFTSREAAMSVKIKRAVSALAIALLLAGGVLYFNFVSKQIYMESRAAVHDCFRILCHLHIQVFHR